LLTGRYVDPARAVALGVFDAVVPATGLLGKARERARELQRQPYEPSVKFRHVAGTDVPPLSESAVREAVRAHGVSDEDFERYPAYGAIVESVMRGARLPLPEATAVEMRQFLRLMFNPVAGNMIRTLFINRQRADRQLAPPRDTSVGRVRHGEWSAVAAGWPEALAKSKLTCEADASLPRDTIVLVDSHEQEHRIAVRGLEVDDVDHYTSATAILSSSGPYGQVLEIVAANEASASALAFLATRVGALPYRTPGRVSALRRLAAARQRAPAPGLDAQAAAALELDIDGMVPDIEILDVAACVSGVTPPYLGGPFAYAWQNRNRLRELLSSDERTAWSAAAPRLQAAFA
jgi:3-hydroxyacyl-CoA dehydrogenase/enoyl-CoA hydratase/3-hydroxybutyryl-CoA epimerase